MRKPSPSTKTVLAALLNQADRTFHGYELLDITGLKSGTLYPILMRLDERGYLESSWVPSSIAGRPARHAYRLTLEGISYAKEHVGAANEARNATAPIKARPAR